MLYKDQSYPLSNSFLIYQLQNNQTLRQIKLYLRQLWDCRLKTVCNSRIQPNFSSKIDFMSQNAVLKQRSITGLIFAAVLIGLIFSGRYGAMILGAVILIVGTYEYIRMVWPNESQKLNLAICLNVFMAFGLIWVVEPYSNAYLSLLILSCLAFLAGIINLYKSFIDHKKWYAVVSLFYLGLPLGLFMSFVFNHSIYNEVIWMGLFLMIWMSDSFAYLVGSRIGKRKLFEKISPKKSWEGFIGAGLITLPLAFIFGNSLFSNPEQLYGLNSEYFQRTGFFWLLIAAIAWTLGTWGDLAESSIKRIFNVKDSGTLLPGHGGILDRFDSFIYILPFILLLLFFCTNL